ncbi:nuclear transport factor 2 family protein [uncultured Pseudoflavonifractor sp.]|uniref:sensor domain-containing diguanylate cyclase n=1 Tax=uncultured Pseudoflavonifractor sp. TaxID=1221379 RepID=UPI00260056AD|nr:nuclear transport factor 2 family protein [uncultured Pseudoflavonifractor sp.]
MTRPVAPSGGQEAEALTSLMVHKHYCKNDVEAIIALMDRDIVWLGTAENEYAAGLDTVAEIFRRFAGQVPRCNVSGETYSTLPLGADAWLCAGRMWIATDPSTGISLRVHQRITTVFRRTDRGLRCCHIHISNPYEEMVEDDVGFPVKMARQSYQYLQEQIEAQKKQIAAQTAALRRMSFEDALTGVYNRNKFSQVADSRAAFSRLGVACFDLNGLKEANDHLGHSAGDELLRRGGGPGRHGGAGHQLLGGSVLAGAKLLPQGAAGRGRPADVPGQAPLLQSKTERPPQPALTPVFPLIFHIFVRNPDIQEVFSCPIRNLSSGTAPTPSSSPPPGRPLPSGVSGSTPCPRSRWGRRWAISLV